MLIYNPWGKGGLGESTPTQRASSRPRVSSNLPRLDEKASSGRARRGAYGNVESCMTSVDGKFRSDNYELWQSDVGIAVVAVTAVMRLFDSRKSY
jgi:hypothetical protein